MRGHLYFDGPQNRGEMYSTSIVTVNDAVMLSTAKCPRQWYHSMHVCTCSNTNVHVCMCIYAALSVCVFLYIRMYRYIFVYMYLCSHMYIYVYE